MNKTSIIAIIIGILVIFATLAVFLLSRDNSALDTDNNDDRDQDVATESTSEADLTIEMSDFKYSQKLIEIERGERVTIELKTVNGTHDFVIDELDINSGTINRGSSKLIEISVPEDTEPGDYEFYCSIMNHRALGMVGTLRVK